MTEPIYTTQAAVQAVLGLDHTEIVNNELFVLTDSWIIGQANMRAIPLSLLLAPALGAAAAYYCAALYINARKSDISFLAMISIDGKTFQDSNNARDFCMVRAIEALDSYCDGPAKPFVIFNEYRDSPETGGQTWPDL
jgi:phosphate/sulfate permease